MFNKLKIISKAWINVFRKNTTKEHKRRASICETCPLAAYKKYTDFIDDELKDVKGLVCLDCGCPLIAKIRSEDNCYKWEI